MVIVIINRLRPKFRLLYDFHLLFTRRFLMSDLSRSIILSRDLDETCCFEMMEMKNVYCLFLAIIIDAQCKT